MHLEINMKGKIHIFYLNLTKKFQNVFIFELLLKLFSCT